MKKISITFAALCVWAFGASAQITQEQANEKVKQYLQTETGQPAELYINKNAPNDEGINITTSHEETFKAQYACWTYRVHEPEQRRYLFVKASDGSVLEVIASNDQSSGGNWQLLKDETTNIDVYNETTLYPNPVSDIVYIPCNGSILIEIYDLQGICVFSEQVFCEKQYQLSLSFLKQGVYMVHNGNQTHRIVKQ